MTHNYLKSIFSLIALIALPLAGNAQNNTLLTIGDHQFSVEEFNYIYEKNNNLSQEPVSREEYVDLFVNYKLKVTEAMAQGYDTMPSFKRELEYYRNELAKPYLSDKKATDEVVAEAYRHMSNEVEASHILIKLPASPTPVDTLQAYREIEKLRGLITDEITFGKVASEHSQCPSSAQKGHLGYFTGFMMVYPFEKAAFNTPVGEVSPIIRTSFGYHIIFVHNKRPNRGEVKAAHIMKMFPQNAPQTVKDKAKTEIDSIYNLLKAGGDFTALAMANSDDKNSLRENGELPWFSTGRMVPEFAEAAFALTDSGQLSEPIQTPFGWHIIKLIDTRPIASLEDSKDDILEKVKRDERAYAGKKATIERLKKDYSYNENTAALQQLKRTVKEHSALSPEDLNAKISQLNLTLGTFGDAKVSASDFAAFITSNRGRIESSDVAFDKQWNSFTDDQLLNYEKGRLEEKYPDFKFLMNEYHDGLLIFEISQKEIWNKASEDTVGLAEFFNAKMEDYRLPERYDGTLVWCKTKKQHKQALAILKDVSSINDSLKTLLNPIATLETGTFTKGQYAALDKSVWKLETKKKDTFKYLLSVGEVKPARERELKEIRGQVMSDYQNALEIKWVDQLKKKYQPVVDKVVLKPSKI